MPGGRVYVVSSPDYISNIQKNPRDLSFWFIEASLTNQQDDAGTGSVTPRAQAPRRTS